MSQTLDEVEIVGYPKRHRELIQIRHLLEPYPTEAREIHTQFKETLILARPTQKVSSENWRGKLMYCDLSRGVSWARRYFMSETV